MRIVYSVGLSDLLAFDWFHQHDRAGKAKRLLLFRYALIVLIAVLGFWELFRQSGSAAVVIPYVLAVLVFLGILLILTRFSRRRFIVSAYSEGNNCSVFGDGRILSFNDKEIWATNPVLESRISWDAVAKIARAEDYLFIYLSSISALIVPRKSVVEGNFDEFASAIAEQFAKSSDNTATANSLTKCAFSDPLRSYEKAFSICGFFSAIGFLVVFCIVLLLPTCLSNGSCSKSSDSVIGTITCEFNKETGLFIASHKASNSPNNLKILGQIKNNCSKTMKGISLQVDIYSSSGEFVDQCQGYVPSSIPPNHQENFRVDCLGGDRDPVPDFARYEIKISDGYSE